MDENLHLLDDLHTFGVGMSGIEAMPSVSAKGDGYGPALIREYARLLPPSYPEKRFVAEHERQGSVSVEMFFDLAQIYGLGDTAPLLLDAVDRFGLLSPSDLRIALAPIWTAPMEPEPILGTARWVEMFRAAGFCPPEEPIVAYRGATEEHRFEMSWSTDMERAVSFARHYEATDQWAENPQQAFVYRATVQPEAVLCLVRKTAMGDWDHEVIVDPSLIMIEGYYHLDEW